MKKVFIRNLTKTFTTLNRQVTALRSVNLTIEPQEFFVLLGPSGCGKSTLLNLIAGLEKPTDGEIRFGDTTFSSMKNDLFVSPRERNIAMVFQNYALYPHMSVAENIEFPLKIRKIGKKERSALVQDTASMLKIENVLHAKPGELSGGQRQRVAIARAIVRKPSLFLLDEPLSNLDAQLRASTRNYLKTLQKQLGITTIYVTHDQVEAMTLGDRIALLNGGSIEQTGSPDQLYHNPTSPFVAKFIGSPPMNILDAELIPEQNPLSIDLLGQRRVVPEHWKDKIPPGRSSFKVGIRPEHIVLGSKSQSGVISVKVSAVEVMGRESIIYADFNGTSISLISTTSVPKPGELIQIVLDTGKLHLFSAENE